MFIRLHLFYSIQNIPQNEDIASTTPLLILFSHEIRMSIIWVTKEIMSFLWW